MREPAAIGEVGREPTRLARVLSALLLLALLLGACTPGARLAPTPATDTKPPAPPTAAPTARTTDAPAPSAALMPAAPPTTAPAAAAARLVTHAKGETWIPGEPRRVAVLVNFLIDHVLALGLPPVAATTDQGAGDQMPLYLAERLRGTKPVGLALSPNLEALLAVQPDLILGISPAQDAFYDNLAQIAPTVLLEIGADWRSMLRRVGEVLGRQEAAQLRLAAFDQKAAQAKARLQQAVGNQSVLLLLVMPKEVRIYGPASAPGKILYQDLGLEPPAGLPADDAIRPISLEVLPQLNADHLFVVTRSREAASQQALSELRANALWQGLPAVQQGHVYPVDREAWILGRGVLAYEQVIADVLKALVR